MPDTPATQPPGHLVPEASARRPSGLDWAVRVGAVMVAVGLVATIATLLPLFTWLDPMPVGVYLLCFLGPLGFGLILVALWQRARTRHHRLRGSPESP